MRRPSTTSRLVRLVVLGAWTVVAGAWGTAGEAPVGARLSREGWTATSSVSCSSEPPPRALDGRADTRFSTCEPQRPGQWYQLDMQEPRVLTGITLDAGISAGDYPRAFSIYAGNDRANLGPPVARGAGVAQVVSIAISPPREARYVRIVQTGKGPSWWSIHELEVYGVPP
jgi:hypothetical protein